MGGSAIAAADGMGGEEKWSKLAKRGPKWSKLAKRGPKALNDQLMQKSSAEGALNKLIIFLISVEENNKHPSRPRSLSRR